MQKKLKIITGIATAAILLGGTFAFADMGHPSHASKSSATKTSQVTHKSQHGKSSSGSTNNDSNKISLVQNALIGHGFEIEPVTYNGLDVDTAMGQPNAPQNLVHDYTQFYYFTDAHSDRTTGLGMYVGSQTKQYQITDTALILDDGQYKIPYQITNGKVTFNQWSQSFDNQNTFVFSFKESSDAKSIIDEKPVQDGINKDQKDYPNEGGSQSANSSSDSQSSSSSSNDDNDNNDSTYNDDTDNTDQDSSSSSSQNNSQGDDDANNQSAPTTGDQDAA
ncbi:hypothetical protein [Fructobacillus ficulneus]|uniref:Uncharacterized protein n=1 Tax=Fructobacillus ficulneus TaxID=157463 RepID=A0A0K8MGA7_9LACO|nr:hypothetical protein [Fructobacillus ficulneus]GAO99233.1 hypothetical protein FFIC_090570 [Fructobacillus ficulneus]